jgi:hypothetical protein
MAGGSGKPIFDVLQPGPSKFAYGTGHIEGAMMRGAIYRGMAAYSEIQATNKGGQISDWTPINYQHGSGPPRYADVYETAIGTNGQKFLELTISQMVSGHRGPESAAEWATNNIYNIQVVLPSGKVLTMSEIMRNVAPEDAAFLESKGLSDAQITEALVNGRTTLPNGKEWVGTKEYATSKNVIIPLEGEPAGDIKIVTWENRSQWDYNRDGTVEPSGYPEGRKFILSYDGQS